MFVGTRLTVKKMSVLHKESSALRIDSLNPCSDHGVMDNSRQMTLSYAGWAVPTAEP